MDYLIEIGTEELPAGTTGQIADNFKKLFLEKIKEFTLEVSEPKLFSTPRRIALLFKDLPAKTAASVEVVKGPGKQAPAQALESFLTKNGITQEDLFEENGRYCYKKTVAPKAIEEVLKASLEFASSNLSGEKWMTWANGEFNFSRPVRWLVSLLDNKVFPVELFGLKAGSKTRVNRLLESESEGIKFVEIKSATDYEETLRKNLVEPEREARKKLIVDQVIKLENQYGIQTDILNKQSLLEEIADLLEWPIALVGEFDKKFLELPEFLTTTVLEHHQRYFPCYHPPTPLKGGAKNKELAQEVGKEENSSALFPLSRGLGGNNLSNKFIFIANCLPKAQTNVIQGNQRVLTARLKDAEFFVQEDLKVPLIDRKEKLAQMTFQKELQDQKIDATMKSKAGRLVSICTELAKVTNLGKTETDDLLRAAELAKCDLGSSMVFEFPELQGKTGAFIARKQNEKEEVCKAIEEQYNSLASNDKLPTKLGALLSIADQIDNITSIFLIGKTPTGSADPFGLRRQAQWICYLLKNSEEIKQKIEQTPTLEKVFEIAFKVLKDSSDQEFQEFFYQSKDKKISLAEFLYQRLLYIWIYDRSSNLSETPEHISAFIPSEKSLKFDLSLLLSNITKFGQANHKELLESLSGIRRVSRIIKSEQLAELSDSKGLEKEELALLEALQKIKKDGTANWSELNELIEPINNFFDNVLVNDPKDSQGTTRRKNLLYTLLKKVNEKYLFPDWDKLVVYLENKTK